VAFRADRDCLKSLDNGVVASEGDHTPERIALLKKRRAAFHAEWRAWYKQANKSRAWYYHLHLEVFEDKTGCWLGRIWDTANEVLSHSADDSSDWDQSKANLLAIARASLVAEFLDRSFPVVEVQWVDVTDSAAHPDYFALPDV
jgi:hypothetical protein